MKILKTIFQFAAAVCLLPSFAAPGSNHISQAWVADKGNGSYVNPIINADYSDPDAIRVGEDYYMTASSFTQSPGLPILHSTDLVNWEIVNNALPIIEPADFYATTRYGKGVWAPSIRYHNGEYYIFYGDPDFGVYMVKTKDPRGEWEKPVLVAAGKGIIDTTPLWDEDGKAYLVNAWAASRSGMNSVLTVTEMDPDGTRLIGNPVLVFNGLDNEGANHTVEGPKFYKLNGYYYILAPAGGVEKGWQLAMRSKSPFGPYERKVVMAQGDTDINGPHQGALVDTPDGNYWFVNFQDKGMLGRVLHLNPVNWVDGWPVMGIDKDGDGCGEPVKGGVKPVKSSVIKTPQDSDDFNSPFLAPQWSWSANYQPLFGFPTSDGYVRVYGHFLSEDFVNFWEVPNLLTQKFPSETFTATAKVRVSSRHDGQQSGLIIMGRDYARLSVEKEGNDFDISLITCKDAEDGNKETVTPVGKIPVHQYNAGAKEVYDCDVWLRVNVKNGLCSFSYSTDGKKFTPVKQTFNAREGKWIGARIGFFSVQPSTQTDRGWLDIDSFSITK